MFYIWGLIDLGLPGSGGPCLKSQHYEAEVGGFVSFRPSWSTEGASGQTKIHSETKTKNNNNKKTTTTK